MIEVVVNGKTLNLQKSLLKVLAESYGRNWDLEYVKNILGWYFGENGVRANVLNLLLFFCSYLV